MKFASILPLTMLLATTSVFGQSFTQGPGMDPSKCAVGLQIERSSGLFQFENAIAVPAVPVAPKAEQWFDFTMTNFSAREIVKVEVTAYGLSHKWRTTPVSTPAPDLWKTVDVALNVRGNSSASRELPLGHFSTITTVDVNSVTYADGSAWHASSPGTCSVAPNPLMRIGAQ